MNKTDNFNTKQVADSDGNSKNMSSMSKSRDSHSKKKVKHTDNKFIQNAF